MSNLYCAIALHVHYTGVSISTDDRQNTSATSLREVGYLFPKLEAGDKVLN